MAGYFSHQEPSNEFLSAATGAMSVIGLFAPAIIALWMSWSNPELWKDLKKRAISLKGINPTYLAITVLFMPASILLAQAISLLFGYSSEQFHFAAKFSGFSAGIFPGWFMIFLAPMVEELGWHTYGTDCLRQRMNLFFTSVLFAVYWAFWHVPLSSIKNYYHSNVAHSGLLYSVNFMVSIIPFVILMNWLYYKTRRNILVAIIFHTTAGVFNELFNTHPDSKVIQTGILIVISIILVAKEKGFFFQLGYRETSNVQG